MKRLVWGVAVVLTVVGAGATALWAWPVGTGAGSAVNLGGMEGDPDRGAYLARMAGCIACHTDIEGGGAALAGGPPLKTKFGTFYGPNLTTDTEKGIGAWTIEDFARAVRRGVSPDGEPYYPAFPYPFYAAFSDQDIADLWAAFQTVPAVAEAAPEHEMVFPFSFRPGLKLWQAAFLDGQPHRVDPSRSDLWNRGAFLVTGPTHCGACHTPRNFAGAREAELRLHGAPDLPNGGKSPPITAEALKAEGWTIEDMVYALRTGITPSGDAFGGAMAEVVREGTAFLEDRDLQAIATYILDAE